MSLRRYLNSLSVAISIFLCSSAHAVPIVYEFSGTVLRGSLNGVTFTNKAFTVDVFGNTSGVVSGGAGVLVNPASSVTFSIAGVGSGSLLDTYQMFLTSDAVGFLNLLDPNGPLDRIDVLNGAFAGYALATAFGPINTGSNFIGQFLPDATTAGPLDMFAGHV
jgi:hypothetical protein